MLTIMAILIIRVAKIFIVEFLLAAANKEKMLSKQNLTRAFDIFDTDKSGKISADKVKEILGMGRKIDESVWGKIINEVDLNSDGEISFDEFQEMMNKFI